MNITSTPITASYATWQVAILPLVGGLVSPLLSWFIYRLSRQRLKRKETLKSSAHVFYRILSGVLLSQFLCHTVLPSTSLDSFDTPLTSLDVKYTFYFILLGYFFIDTCEAISRIWNTNTRYVAPLDEQVRDDIGLNKETMEEQSIVVAQDVGSSDFSNTVWALQDYSKDKRKRQWLLGLLLSVFCIITVMDGMLLVYRNPQGDLQMIGTIVSFFINGMSMSVAVYGAMLHAKFHVTEELKPRIWWWCSVTLLWSAALICCTVPVLMQLSLAMAQAIINNRIMLAFYGVAAGCVLKLQQYYHNRKVENIDRRETLVGIIVFFAALAQGVATSLWL